MSNLKNRSEILFLYDAKNSNPNGDPMNSNRPRLDEETGKCLVTDVRLKRTIRDYLVNKGYDGKNNLGDIFIRSVEGKEVTLEERSKTYENQDEFTSKFIDVRLFGGVSASKTKGKNFHLTGAVQFGMGFSLNKVRENFIKGTGAFTNKEGAEQKTFREEYNLTYALIGFHGVVNENAAKWTKTTENDVEELLEGMWNGTKDLLTRSKKGHMPRLLLKIDYIGGFFIGDLLERLSLIPNEGKTEESYDDINDFTVDTAKLNAELKKYADRIEKVHLQIDDRIKLTEPIFQK